MDLDSVHLEAFLKNILFCFFTVWQASASFQAGFVSGAIVECRKCASTSEPPQQPGHKQEVPFNMWAIHMQESATVKDIVSD